LASFFACSSLESITIPPSVTSMGIAVFDNCDPSILTVYCYAPADSPVRNYAYPAGTTLVARYLVSFDANGGAPSPANVTKLQGETLGALPTPGRTGYTLEGWYTAKTGGSKVTPSTLPTGVVTYYARWTLNSYTVTFTNWTGAVYTTKKVSHGQTLAPPAGPARSGYTFIGWDNPLTNVTANLTVTARYSAKTYAIKYNANGGKVAGKTAASVKRSHDASLGKLPTPKRAGYKFQGWYTGKVKGKKIGTKTKVTKAVTYYAHWKANTYKVTYNAVGGKVAGKKAASVKRTYKSSLGKLPVPKKAGYKFTGWYTGKVKGKKVGAKTKVAKNVTLYAHWKRVR
jgi:uncharacterized repeat protein (TIGR02543 family)